MKTIRNTATPLLVLLVVAGIAPWAQAQPATPGSPVLNLPASVPNEPLPPGYLDYVRVLQEPWTLNRREVSNEPEPYDHLPWLMPFLAIKTPPHPALEPALKTFARFKSTADQRLAFLKSRFAASEDQKARDDDEAYDAYRRMFETGWDSGRAPLISEDDMESGFAGYAHGMRRARAKTVAAFSRRIGEVYPASLPEANLMTARIFPTHIEYVNTSGRRLVGLTVVADVVHFTSAPEPSTVHLCYVDELEPGASIYLSTRLNRMALRPPTACVISGADEAWLAAAGGIVEIRLTAWDVQAHMPRVRVPFPDQVLRAGAFEMASVRRAYFPTIANLKLRTIRQTPPDYNPEYQLRVPTDQEWAMAAAKRVMLFTPPGSAPYLEAVRFLNAPGGTSTRADKATEAGIKARLVGRYEGRRSYLLDAAQEKEYQAQNAVYQLKQFPGAAWTVLEIRSLDPDNRIKGVLWAGETPRFQRTFTGKLVRKEDSDYRLDIKMDGKPGDGDGSFRNFVISAWEMMLYFEHDDLVGRARAGRFMHELRLKRVAPAAPPAPAVTVAAVPEVDEARMLKSATTFPLTVVLNRKVSLPTETGVVGIPSGTELEVRSATNDVYRVSYQGTEWEVPRAKLEKMPVR